MHYVVLHYIMHNLEAFNSTIVYDDDCAEFATNEISNFKIDQIYERIECSTKYSISIVPFMILYVRLSHNIEVAFDSICGIY